MLIHAFRKLPSALNMYMKINILISINCKYIIVLPIEKSQNDADEFFHDLDHTAVLAWTHYSNGGSVVYDSIPTMSQWSFHLLKGHHYQN